MVKKSGEEPAIYKPRDVIRSVDDRSEYPVDFIREYFVNSDKNLEEVAVQLNLPVSEVKRHAESGLQSWYQLKHDMFEQRMKYFMQLNIDSLADTHAMLEDGHFLTLVQLKGMQEILKAYYLKHGHLFRVKEDGELSLDMYGLPIMLPLPNGPKHFLALEGFLKVKEGTKQALNQVYQGMKEGAKPKDDTLDIEASGIFDEKKD